MWIWMVIFEVQAPLFQVRKCVCVCTECLGEFGVCIHITCVRVVCTLDAVGCVFRLCTVCTMGACVYMSLYWRMT